MEKPGFETYEKIEQAIEDFRKDAKKFYEKGNQSAGVRARVALDRLAKLKVQWRKETVNG